MFRQLLVIAVLFFPLAPLAGQEIDANITTENRSPCTIADQSPDAAERASFLVMFKQGPPAQRLQQAKSFLAQFPQSAFLSQAYEVAARASFGLEDYDAGLNYARESLTLLPENPLLLVSVADVQARKPLTDPAIPDPLNPSQFPAHFYP